MKFVRLFILCGILTAMSGCTGGGREASTPANNTLAAKDSTAKEECMFDIRGFEILDTTGGSVLEKYEIDTVRHIIRGILRNGYHFQCKLFVCDSWGFNSTFKKRVDRTGVITLNVDSILKLFSVLPTTPDRERFIGKIMGSKEKFNISIGTGSQEINLSDPEIGEFFVYVSKYGAILKVDIVLDSYY